MYKFNQLKCSFIWHFARKKTSQNFIADNFLIFFKREWFKTLIRGLKYTTPGCLTEAQVKQYTTWSNHCVDRVTTTLRFFIRFDWVQISLETFFFVLFLWSILKTIYNHNLQLYSCLDNKMGWNASLELWFTIVNN